MLSPRQYTTLLSSIHIYYPVYNFILLVHLAPLANSAVSPHEISFASIQLYSSRTAGLVGLDPTHHLAAMDGLANRSATIYGTAP
jgi:hypothetical protein